MPSNKKRTTANQSRKSNPRNLKKRVNAKKSQSSKNNLKQKLYNIRFKLPKLTFRINKKEFYISILLLLTLLIIDASIQLYFQRKVIAYSQKGIIITKYEILDRFLNTATPTSPQFILQQTLAEKLLEKEAKLKNIKVTDEEVTAQLNDILNRNNISIEQLAVQTGTTPDELRRLIKYNLITKKLISLDYTPTEEEIKDFYEKNKESVFKGQSLEEIKDTIINYLKQQYAQRKYSEWYYEKLQEYNVKELLDVNIPYKLGSGINYFLPIIVNTYLDTQLRSPIIKFDLPKPVAAVKDKVAGKLADIFQRN